MTDDLVPQGDVRVLREDDERVAPLLADGWAVESESWGARLHVESGDGLARLAARVEDVRAQGRRVVRLTPEDVGAIVALDAACALDYPVTPATCRTGPRCAQPSRKAAGGRTAPAARPATSTPSRCCTPPRTGSTQSSP